MIFLNFENFWNLGISRFPGTQEILGVPGDPGVPEKQNNL